LLCEQLGHQAFAPFAKVFYLFVEVYVLWHFLGSNHGVDIVYQ
jgi:hypothetical protein